jgi:DNA-binding MarR family transcriptional regulator
MAEFPDQQQMTATLLNFVFFLGARMDEKQGDFEQALEGCQAEDLKLLFLWVEPRGALIVKEIARELRGVSLSTLTRMLDRLEQRGYIKRTLNPEDRRSFRVAPTEKGEQLIGAFLQQWHKLAQGILKILTPTEQLVLVELLKKIQQHWPSDGGAFDADLGI